MIVAHDNSPDDDPDDPRPDGPAGARAMAIHDGEEVWPVTRSWPRTDPFCYPLRRGVRIGGTRFYARIERVPVSDPDGGPTEGIVVRIDRAESERGELDFSPGDVAEARRLLRMAA